MIKIEDPLWAQKENTHLTYHAYCLTCNDPTDTVLQLIEGVDKAQALQSARAHEREQGYGHSILVDYSFTEIPAQEEPKYAPKAQ